MVVWGGGRGERVEGGGAGGRWAPGGVGRGGAAHPGGPLFDNPCVVVSRRLGGLTRTSTRRTLFSFARDSRRYAGLRHIDQESHRRRLPPAVVIVVSQRSPRHSGFIA